MLIYEMVAVAVIVVTEMILSGRWVPAYWRYGLTIFSARRSTRPIDVGTEERLEAMFKGSVGVPLLFRRLSPTEIAFRERAFGSSWFNYTPLMHGLIRYVPEEGATVVTGLVNWSNVVVVTVLVTVWLRDTPRDVYQPFLLIAAATAAGMYAIQAYRYRKVADALHRYQVATV